MTWADASSDLNVSRPVSTSLADHICFIVPCMLRRFLDTVGSS